MFSPKKGTTAAAPRSASYENGPCARNVYTLHNGEHSTPAQHIAQICDSAGTEPKNHPVGTFEIPPLRGSIRGEHSTRDGHQKTTRENNETPSEEGVSL